MINNEAFNRALRANANFASLGKQDRQAFLDEEFVNSRMLTKLGVEADSSPANIPGIDTLQGPFERIDNFSLPYAIELMGMPNTFKTSAINSYLAETWKDGTRNWYFAVPEGTELIPKEYREMKQEDPFLYSMLVGLGSWVASYGSIAHINEFKMLLQDRGSYDRGVFRKALSMMGRVDPGIMRTQELWEYGLEHPAMPVGGVVLCLQRPELCQARGSTMELTELRLLYQQYLCLYQEMRQEDKLVPSFIALDMEVDADKGMAKIENGIKQIVYRAFKYGLHIPAAIDFKLV